MLACSKGVELHHLSKAEDVSSIDCCLHAYLILRPVPDLAFSEMRFLQKVKPQEEQRDGEERTSADKRREKKDHKRRKVEEISSYFTGKPTPGKEKESHGRRSGSEKRRHDHVQSGEHPRRASTSEHGRDRSCSVVPTIELPNKPFLGFGSRGSRPESHGSIPWSTSPAQHIIAPVIQEGRSSGIVTYHRDQPHALPKAEARASDTTPNPSLKSTRLPTTQQLTQEREAETGNGRQGTVTHNAAKTQNILVASVDEDCHQLDYVRRTSSSPMKRLLAACDDAIAVFKPKQRPYHAGKQPADIKATNEPERDTSLRHNQKQCQGQICDEDNDPGISSRHYAGHLNHGEAGVVRSQEHTNTSHRQLQNIYQSSNPAPTELPEYRRYYNNDRGFSCPSYAPARVRNAHDDQSVDRVTEYIDANRLPQPSRLDHETDVRPYANEQYRIPAHVEWSQQDVSTFGTAKMQHHPEPYQTEPSAPERYPIEEYAGMRPPDHYPSRFLHVDVSAQHPDIDTHADCLGISNTDVPIGDAYSTEDQYHQAQDIYMNQANLRAELLGEARYGDHTYEGYAHEGIASADYAQEFHAYEVYAHEARMSGDYEDIAEAALGAAAQEGGIGPLEAYFQHENDGKTNSGTFWHP